MVKKVIFMLVLVIIVFSAGFLTAKSLEKPNLEVSEPETTIPEKAAFTFYPPEQDSPYNWIKESQIKVYQDKVEIQLSNAQWATFTNTNSMDPILDEDSHAIQIIPTSIKDIHVGDIVSYESRYAEGVLIHRVISLGNDGEWYAIVKGDNNSTADPGRIRFNQIKRVLVAVIY